MILILLNSPILNNIHININNHITHYQNNKNTSNQITIYILEQNNHYKHTTLKSLKNDTKFIKNPKHTQNLLITLNKKQHLQQQISKKILTDNILITPNSIKPDTTF